VKILVIDDEPYIRSLLVAYLERLNFKEIEEASDGETGFAALARFDADLIILDLEMKPMNGLNFLKLLRIGERHRRRDLPVVVVSGVDDEAVFGTALALDANAFVNKQEGLNVIGDRIDRLRDHPQIVKPPAAYRVIPLPAIAKKKKKPASKKHASLPHKKSFTTETPKPSFRRRIQNLKAGDVLAKNLETKRGKLLLNAGTEMTEHLIARIQDLKEITDISEAWVNK